MAKVFCHTLGQNEHSPCTVIYGPAELEVGKSQAYGPSYTHKTNLFYTPQPLTT